MKALSDLLSTDYGLMSLVVIAIVIIRVPNPCPTSSASPIQMSIARSPGPQSPQ